MYENQYQQQNNYAPTMGYQQPMYGMGFQPMYGMNYQAPQMPNIQNPLGEKAQELLKNGNGQKKIIITQEDYDQAVCNHHLANRQDSDIVICLPNGKKRCRICGEEWTDLSDAAPEDVAKATENALDLLNTAQYMWLSLDPQISKNFFQVKAVVKKIPEIVTAAAADFNRYCPVGGPNGVSITPFGDPNTFMLHNMISNGSMGMNTMGMMGGYNVMGQPTPMQQTMLANNGFGYTQQPVQAQPGMPVMVQPTATPAQPVAPVQPTATPAQPVATVTTTTQTLTV